MDLISLLALSFLFFNLALGGVILLKNYASAVHWLLFGITTSVALWIGGLLAVREDVLQLYPWAPVLGLRVAFVGAALIGFFFFFLTLVFPRDIFPRLRKAATYLVSAATALLIIITLFTAGIVQDILAFSDFGFRSEYGDAYGWYALYIAALFAASFSILARQYQTAKPRDKKQIWYFFIGALSSVILIIVSNLFIPALLGVSTVSHLGPLFTLFLVLFTSYAVIKHGFLNVRLIATELFAVLIIATTFVSAVFSPNQQEFLIRGSVFLAVTVFGILLVRGTLREIRALQELSNAKTEFINIASHQLRTPLTAIKGYLSMMDEGGFGDMNDEQKKTVKKLFATNEGMIRLVNDLLNVSRAEQGRLQYVFKKIDLRDLVSDIVERLEISAYDKGLKLTGEAPAQPVWVIADDDKLAQVISNLIDNAIKYTEHGGISITLSPEAEMSGYAVMRITDSGIGIPAEEIETVFDRFIRGRGGQRVSGSGAGLGLYIVKKITEDHHGRVWAESEGEGKGTTFSLELPLAGNPAAPSNTQKDENGSVEPH